MSAKGLLDGLGNEELLVSGLQVSGTSEYINPYFLGSITSVEAFKAANVYGTTTVSGATVLGDNVYATTAVSGPTIKATTLSGTTIYQASKGTLQSSLLGSYASPLYGARINAGSGLLSSSTQWVVFTPAFTAAPAVNLSSRAGGSVVILSAVCAGSFQASGAAPVGEYDWLAIGL